MWNLSGVQMMEIHLQELLHPEACKRLAREVSVPTRSRRYRQLRRWLYRLGQFLVGLGHRLQRVGAPLAVGLEERVTAERHTRA